MQKASVSGSSTRSQPCCARRRRPSRSCSSWRICTRRIRRRFCCCVLWQTLADARLLVIATTRYSDQTATESFAGTVADLARGRRFHHIRLGGLSREEVAELVAAKGDAASSEELVDRIYARTDGHPLFVSEIAQLLATDSEVEVLPQGVRAVVSQRLGLLDEKCRELLALASVVAVNFTRTSGGSERR